MMLPQSGTYTCDSSSTTSAKNVPLQPVAPNDNIIPSEIRRIRVKLSAKKRRQLGVYTDEDATIAAER
jgi:hypothetical protein